VFTHILHYTCTSLGLSLEAYKHVITPLQDGRPGTAPQRRFFKQLKQACRQLTIDGPNCVIGCLPDHTLFMVQDRKKLRPGVVGGKPGCWAFSSEICGLDAAIPDRDKRRKDFQPMHLDTTIVGPDRQEVKYARRRPITPSTLSIKDLPWQIAGTRTNAPCAAAARRSARCRPSNWGSSASADQASVDTGLGLPANVYQVYHGIRQRTDPAYACVGCAMCNLVCPNDAIMPMHSDEADKLRFHVNRGGQPRNRAGGATCPGGLLDQIKFIRISMLTDPALDAGATSSSCAPCWAGSAARGEPAVFSKENGWIPPVREIYPLIIGSMSFGALSPNMWEGLQLGVAYLNEELGMPVRICTGEGGCPPRLLRSRFLKYVILQIASGYFGWDEIIHALPEMKEDPAPSRSNTARGPSPATAACSCGTRSTS
jgi:ferredoxin